MNFDAWLTQWLRQHPVKQPKSIEPDRFTQQVMQRVRALETPPLQERAPRAATFGFWPRLVLAGAGAAVAAMLVLQVRPASAPAPILASSAPQEVSVVLAESSQDDATWVEQSMQLLNELEEDPALQAEDSDTEWLDDVQAVDEAELATSS